jgi:hypothetical protein
MPHTLVRRAGFDTLAKLEAAACCRYREAERLFQQGELLGAVYLFGYSIEIRLKAAYYRSIGLVPNSPLDQHRRRAEDAIRAIPGLPRHPITGGPQPGHDIVGWARLLEQTRAVNARPLSPALARPMYQYVDAVFTSWAEFLRYRANKPYDDEAAAVRLAARWFRANASRLWR